MFRKIFPLFLASLGLILAACSDTINGKAIAAPKVEVFYEQLAKNDATAMFEASHPDFKKAITQEKWAQLVGAIHRKLGKNKTHTMTGWNTKTHNMTTRAVMVFQSEYEHGTATESFTYIVENGQASLLGYQINSFDMLVK